MSNMKEVMQRERSGTEGRQDQEESGIVVHSAARHRSMLCRSTTYCARSAAIGQERGARASGKALGQASKWPVRGGVVVGRHAGRRMWPTAARNLLRHRGRIKLAHGDPRLGAGPPTSHPVHPGSARARTEPGCVPGRGASAVGNQECQCQESIRRFARRVDVQRPKGIEWGVAEPHEVGTDPRNDDRKIDC